MTGKLVVILEVSLYPKKREYFGNCEEKSLLLNRVREPRAALARKIAWFLDLQRGT
jgi:hypothetical protein